VRIELAIDGLAPGGEGVGRAGARTCFVPFTAPGDRVVVEAAPGSGPAHAALLHVVAPGAERVAPACPHFGPGEPARERLCGGCEWLHVAYGAQLVAKERAFHERLQKLGGLAPDSYPALPILASPRPLRYRSRAKLHLDRREGRLVFFRRRSHEPVAIASCALLEEGLEALRAALGPALVAAGLEPREVALEWSALEGKGTAALQVRAATPAVRERAERLASEAGLKGLVLQPDEGALVLVGDPVLRHERVPGDLSAGLSRSRPDVFQQANRGANALLVRSALEMLRPEGADVLELFCGAGNFTGPLSRRAQAVAAVETQGPALELARRDLDGAPVRFFAGDALKLAHAFARETGPEARRFDAVLLDPPREGAKGIGPALRELGLPRALYVSCDPATLARDVKACVQAGYRVAVAQAVDLFPQTHHVEGMVLLERA